MSRLRRIVEARRRAEREATRTVHPDAWPMEAEPGDDLPDTLPDGYVVEHTGGGYFALEGPGGVIVGPSNGKWQGHDAACAAAWRDALPDDGDA